MSSTISALTAGGTPDGAELMEVVQGGNSRRLTAQQIADIGRSTFGKSLVDDADAATARATLGLGNAATATVVTGDTDVTAGRLLTTAPGPLQAFRRGNVLGTVSQSAGVPTGALIERGSNANGSYMRLADGTQRCTRVSLTAVYNSATVLRVDWTFPIAFSARPVLTGINQFAGGTSLTPSLSDINAPATTSAGSSASVGRFDVRSRTGAASFGVSDTLSLDVGAFGTWF